MIEVLAAILTLGCVILLNHKNWIGWPIGIIAAILYGFVFYFEQIYGQVMLQGVFIIQSYYGWYEWKIKKGETLEIQKWSDKLFSQLIGVILLFTSLMVLIIILRIKQGEDLYDTVIQYLDYYIVTLSLLANYLLAKSVLQSWYIWIFVDILLIGLCIYLGLWYTVGLYILLLLNAVNASLKWKKNYEKI